MRDLVISAYAIGAGLLILIDQLTTWLGFFSALLGCAGAIYAIINQRAQHKARRAQHTDP